jgi:hypothetical protein
MLLAIMLSQQPVKVNAWPRAEVPGAIAEALDEGKDERR